MQIKALPSLHLSLLLVGASLGVSFMQPTTAAAQTVPKAYPVRDFFSNPEKAHFRLSQDGRTLGFMQPVAVDGAPRRLNVFVQSLKGSEPLGEPRRLGSHSSSMMPHSTPKRTVTSTPSP